MHELSAVTLSLQSIRNIPDTAVAFRGDIGDSASEPSERFGQTGGSCVPFRASSFRLRMGFLTLSVSMHRTRRVLVVSRRSKDSRAIQCRRRRPLASQASTHVSAPFGVLHVEVEVHIDALLDGASAVQDPCKKLDLTPSPSLDSSCCSP